MSNAGGSLPTDPAQQKIFVNNLVSAGVPKRPREQGASARR
jgi:hypothetical protein